MAPTRTTIRHKLNLLLLVPLLATVLLALPFVASRVDEARAASLSAAAATNARHLSGLLYALQRERLAAVDHIATEGDHQHSLMLRQQAVVDDELADLRARLAAGQSADLVEALDELDGLSKIRAAVATGNARPKQAYEAYRKATDALLDALGLDARTGGSDAASRQLEILDALLHANEQGSRVGAAILVAAVDAQAGRDVLMEASALHTLHSDRFLRVAGADEAQMMRAVDQGSSVLLLQRLAQQVRAADTSLPPGFVPEARAVADSAAVVRQLLLVRTVRDVESAASGNADRAVIAAWTVSVGTALTFALVAGLGVMVSRSIAGPVRQLTRAASRTAALADTELARVSDSERTDDRPPKLPAIPVDSSDEVGDLARAFNRVQATAAQLVQRQTQSRRNVGLMFASVARRTQNLVGGQLALIDQLERDEQDPRLLAELYRLDHLSMRLRRSAESLLVVSGVRDEARIAVPAQIATVLRSALAEIEDFPRVRLVSICDVTVVPDLVADLTLLLAELLENATSYSPPTMLVDVSAERTGYGCRLAVVDHGIGMPAEQLAVENDRFVQRERLDIAPTTVLGLFVVGRLARRHGLAVALRPTPGGGVTAVVDVPVGLLATELPGAAEAAPDAGDRMPGRVAGMPPAIVASEPTGAAARAGGFGWFARDRPERLAAPPQPAQARPERVPSELAPRAAPSDSAPPAEAAPAGPPPPTRGGLTRRVPGASLRDIDPRDRAPLAGAPRETARPEGRGGPSAAAAATTRDPERERAKLDAFAAAVARAAAATESGQSPPQDVAAGRRGEPATFGPGTRTEEGNAG